VKVPWGLSGPPDNLDDVLSALGVTSKPRSSDRLLATLTIFGTGLLLGAGVALLLAPKSGEALRADLRERFRRPHSESPEPSEEATSSTPVGT
jgi:hypothetical protein